jgi:hypothetical protein
MDVGHLHGGTVADCPAGVNGGAPGPKLPLLTESRFLDDTPLTVLERQESSRPVTLTSVGSWFFHMPRFKALCVLAFLLGGLLSLLGLMDYSKGWLTRTSLADALEPPSPLALGSLDWNPAGYAGHPSLKPFVDLVQKHCPGEKSFATVVCLSDLLAERFPHGLPSVELFSAGFDPVATMNNHLAGAPGHCVSRSGILTAALLAVGIPARMVQLVPSYLDRNDRRSGHNALEVWDKRMGWVFFDPTYGGTLQTAAGEQSAAALLAARGQFVWRQLGKIPAAVGHEVLDGQDAYDGNPTPRFNGHLVYPEPWLYTRVGTKQAPGPFNGAFLVVGVPSLRLALGHWLVLGSVAATCLAMLVTVVSMARSYLQLRRAVPRPVSLPVGQGRLDDAAE